MVLWVSILVTDLDFNMSKYMSSQRFLSLVCLCYQLASSKFISTLKRVNMNLKNNLYVFILVIKNYLMHGKKQGYFKATTFSKLSIHTG